MSSAPTFRFVRYCTIRAIEPAAVDDTIFTDYQSDLVTRSLTTDPKRGPREVARACADCQ